MSLVSWSVWSGVQDFPSLARTRLKGSLRTRYSYNCPPALASFGNEYSFANPTVNLLRGNIEEFSQLPRCEVVYLLCLFF
jgi:hypothetical protein